MRQGDDDFAINSRESLALEGVWSEYEMDE